MSRRATLAALGLAALSLGGCAPGDDPLPTAAPPRVAPEVRPDTPGNGLLFRFDAGDVVEAHPSVEGSFLVHFTRSGANAVPAADADGSGVPDFVEQVASIYEQVLTKYRDELGFRAPVSDEGLADNGGDGKFDVYLVDFAGKGDGNYQNDTCDPKNPQICAGYMIQENDYAGYGYPSLATANKILASHEFFHAIQAAYDDGQGSVMAEGSAVWATEQFQPSLSDFEAFLPGFFDNIDRPLDSPLPGPVDPKSYGSAIFFQFLEERFGAGTVRGLLERTENGAGGVADPKWFTALDPYLQEKAQTSFADAFTEFATWNLLTGALADPARSYARGSGYPKVKTNTVSAPYTKDPLRVYYASAQVYRMVPGGRKAMTAAVVAHPGAADETAGLRVLLGTERGGELDPIVTLADATAGTETIDTDGAAALVVMVVNPAQSGESKKPALCVGDAAEVAGCVEAIVATGTGGAGGSGGGAGGSGGGGAQGGSGGGATAPESASGCGCRVASPDADLSGSALALALAAVFYRRRRPSSRWGRERPQTPARLWRATKRPSASK